jgi:diguanylate cyclase (GGDEF)-like protein/PAS domain S-box-containing protein
MIEDVPADVRLVERELAKAGLSPRVRCVQTGDDLIEALRDRLPELVLSDFSLPQFDGMSALHICQAMAPEIPFIFVSGTIGEETAIEAMRLGAADYVLKTRLSRLGPAALRCLKAADDAEKRVQAERRLAQSEQRYQQLVELSPDGIMVIVEGRILFSNSAGIGLCGARSAEEVVGRRLIEFVDPAQQEQMRDRLRAAAQGRDEVSSFLQRYLRADGKRLDVELSLGKFDYGGKRAALVVLRDVSERLRAQEDLRRFRTAIDVTSDAVYLVDASTLQMVDANEGACRMLGRSREELLQMRATDFFPGTPEAELRAHYAQLLASGETSIIELEHRHSDGRAIPVEVVRRGLRSSGGDLIVGVARDIRQRRESEAQMRILRRAVEACVTPILITKCSEPDNPLEYVNPAFERVTGYRAEEVLGRNCRFLQREDRDQSGLESIRNAVRSRREGHAVVRNYRKDGSLFHNELHIAPVRDGSGAVTHFIGIQNDISESRRYQEQLEHQANHDELTGLPNRNLLNDRLAQAASYCQRDGRIMAVVHFDLDAFADVNQAFGSDAGDALLKSLADRLGGCLREGDTLARAGGDELVAVFGGMDDEAAARQAVERLQALFQDPFELAGQEVALTACLGVSLFPQDGEDAQAVLRNAGVALQRAKGMGSSNCQYFSEHMTVRSRHQLALSAQLRRALDREEFWVAYQPQFDLRSRRVVGAEALVRWRSPELGECSPKDFIPMAEQSGLIIDLGNWVMRQACAQGAAWARGARSDFRIAVNVSARQFGSDGLIEAVTSALAVSGLAPANLELELTESMLMHNQGSVIERMRALSALGVQLSIDDFGTGYSSLSYLHKLPVDCLKLDQSFVRDLVHDPDDAAIARTVVTLGQSLKLRVIAEGVESEEQARFLNLLGCEEVQGYLFGRPMSASDFVAAMFAGESADG